MRTSPCGGSADRLRIVLAPVRAACTCRGARPHFSVDALGIHAVFGQRCAESYRLAVQRPRTREIIINACCCRELLVLATFFASSGVALCLRLCTARCRTSVRQPLLPRILNWVPNGRAQLRPKKYVVCRCRFNPHAPLQLKIKYNRERETKLVSL